MPPPTQEGGHANYFAVTLSRDTLPEEHRCGPVQNHILYIFPSPTFFLGGGANPLTFLRVNVEFSQKLMGFYKNVAVVQ